ncbi:MAG: precorrin-6A/cobalt-precorrin-6A reductase [Thiolinea sp.]
MGGTGQALQLAQKLLQQGHSLIYSIAGLVRQPDLPCPIISGGFTQFGGMAAFIRARKIGLIIDATHPYAAQISQHAVTAAQDCGIPCWRLQRPAWQAVDGDNWSEFVDWEDLLPALHGYERVFLSQGRLSAQQLNALIQHRRPGQQYYLRTAVKPVLDLPDWIESIQAIGPFSDADELALFRQLKIDALVSKNSGGEMTVAKLRTARELGVPVLFLRRPGLPEADKAFIEENDLLDGLLEWGQHGENIAG